MLYLTSIGIFDMGVSSTSGSDFAMMCGSYEPKVQYTLMIDYYSDIPLISYAVVEEDFTFILYYSLHNYTEFLIKYKTDIFSGLGTSNLTSTDCCRLGPLCMPFCGTQYTDGFVPIVKSPRVFPMDLPQYIALFNFVSKKQKLKVNF